MLIALVGSDGAGKSTVTTSLAGPGRSEATGLPDRVTVLRSERWDIVRDPASYPSARLLRPDVALGRTCAAEMPGAARLLFFAWSACMALEAREPRPAPGTVTLLDGYWMKHAAVEVVHGLDRSWVESVGAGLPVCDLVIHLKVPPETAWERKRNEEILPYECGGDPECSRASFLAHQGRVGEVLDDWARQFGWLTVDATESAAAVAARVRAATGLPWSARSTAGTAR